MGQIVNNFKPPSFLSDGPPSLDFSELIYISGNPHPRRKKVDSFIFLKFLAYSP